MNKDITKEDKTLAELMKTVLGTFTYEDVKELINQKLDDSKLKKRAAECELFYSTWGKDLLDKLIFEQMKETMTFDGDKKFGCGVVYGIDLVAKLLKEQTDVSLSRLDEDKPDPELPEGMQL